MVTAPIPAQDFLSRFDAGLKRNGNALIGLGSGLLSANNFADGLASGGQGFMQGAQQDSAYATQQKADKKRTDDLNQTVQYLQDKYPDLAQAVQGGLPIGDAYNEAFKRQAPGYAQDGAPSPTSDMQNYQFYANEEMKAGRAPVSFMEFSNPTSAPSLPSSYQEYQLGLKDPGYAASQAPAPKGPTEAAARAGGLLQVVQPDAALLLGDGTTNNPGIFDRLANGGDQNWSNFGVDVAGVGIHPLTFAASPEYRQAKDAVTNIVQQYMYVTSGATAPEPEVRRNALAVTPQPTDSPEQLADKKRRLGDMVKAMQGIADPSAGNAGDGWEVVGVQ